MGRCALQVWILRAQFEGSLEFRGLLERPIFTKRHFHCAANTALEDCALATAAVEYCGPHA